MNRYKSGGPSKATSTTLCQKCLKRGHYSYECTAGRQERPYVSRPSRSQQLLNPKLAPKLTNASAPSTTTTTTTTASTKIIRPDSHDRGRRQPSRSRSRSRSPDLPRRRTTRRSSSRSSSVASISSRRSRSTVSTISTNRSTSRSPIRRAASPEQRSRSPIRGHRDDHPRHGRRRAVDDDDGDADDGRDDDRSRSPVRDRGDRGSRENGRGREDRRDVWNRGTGEQRAGPGSAGVKARERSLSPYSQRVAMTRMMQSEGG